MADAPKNPAAGALAGTAREPALRPVRRSATLDALLKELDRPLDDIDWRKAASPTGPGEEPQGILSRIKRERQHRRELSRARAAAAKAFGTRPRLSARKRATLMLSGGAAGLAAMTGPALSQQEDDAAYHRVVMGEGDRVPAHQLTPSNDFKRALIQEEGVRYTVYRDVAGYPTVGVGHLVRPQDGLRVGDRIDDRQVMRFLDADLAVAAKGVHDLVGDLPLHQHEFDALLDLVYNVGGGTVDDERSPRLNAAIAARDYDGIAAELEYTRAGGNAVRGLAYRSERRAAMFADASYDDPRTTFS